MRHAPIPVLFANVQPKNKTAPAEQAKAVIEKKGGKPYMLNAGNGISTSIDMQPPARRNGPDTSRRAAAMAKPEAASRRGRVLEIIVARGSHGATDIEIAEALNWQIPMTTPRRGELVRLGLVRDSGARRLSPWGRPSIVWTATAEGGGA